MSITREIPRRQHRLRVGDVETFVDDRGEGPVVLLLHGNPDSSRLWHDVAPYLEEKYRCLMPDLPGFGHSRRVSTGEADSTAFSLESHVRWIQGLLDALDIRGSIHLVVHDFGGPYGFAWAVRHPERIASVLASDTLFMSDYRWHFWARIWRSRPLGEISMPLMGWALFKWELRRGSKNLSEEHLRRTWELVTPSMKRTVLDLYRATDPEVFRGWEDELRSLLSKIPSLALWGEKDPYIAPSWAHHLGARSVEIVPNCGHWLPAEAPEIFADRLLRLLEAC